jgi:hypothetical protein
MYTRGADILSQRVHARFPHLTANEENGLHKFGDVHPQATFE